MKIALRILFALGFIACLQAARAEAAQVWVDCTPSNVAAYEGRVHVRCTASIGGGIRFFAVSATDAAWAARFTSVATTALVAGRPLQVLYDPADTSGAAFGCQMSDCRKAYALAVR